MCKKIGVLLSVLLLSTNAMAVLVDNFDSYASGQVDTVTTNWKGTADVSIETDPDNAANKVIRVQENTGTQKAVYGILSKEASIREGATKTLYLRFRATNPIDSAFGLTNVDSPDVGGSDWGQFGPQVSVYSGSFRVRDSGAWSVAGTYTPLQWYNMWMVVDNAADTMKVYLHNRPNEAASEADLVSVGGKTSFGFRNAIADTLDRFYWRAQNPGGERFVWIDDIHMINGVSLAIPASEKGLVSTPKPEDKAVDVPRDGSLSWIPGEFAASHDVYFGTVFDDVNTASRTDPKGVLASQGQTASTFDPAGLLDFGLTYYWRIDEVNAPNKPGLYKGEVWSLTAETYGYRIATAIKATASSFSNALTGPEKTIDGSGLDVLDRHSTSSSQMWLSKKSQTPVWIQYEFNAVYSLHQMWVWNQNQMTELDNGYGAMDVTIDVSTDGTTWTALANVPQFAQATGEDAYVHNTIVEFDGVRAKYVRLNINSNWGGVKNSGLSEVRFFYVPVKAFGPTPATGATGVAVDGILNWRAGRTAASHEVYLGTDPNALTKVSTVTDHRYHLGSAGAEYNRTYYWRVDEVNEAQAPKTIEGDVWSFSTLPYFVVENFDSYDDNCNRIFYAWADGYGATPDVECGGTSIAGNGSGSTVGNPSAPYAEQTVVHGGRQSMPLFFDNPGATSYSEATRTFAVPQDWVQGGIKTLVLYFHGALDNAAGQMYVKINNSKVVYNGKSDVLTTPLWMQWNIDLASMGGSMRSVTSLTIGISGSGKGIVYVDDISLYRSAPAVVQPVDPGTAGLSVYYAMDGDVKDGSGKGNHGTAMGDPIFVDAPAGFGKAMQFDGTNDYVDLPIGSLISTLSSATIATRVNFDTTSTGSYQRIFDFGTGTTAYLFLTPRVSTNGVVRAAIRNTNSTAESQANSPRMMPSGWHHVAVSINGVTKTMELYFDGDRVAGGPTTVLLSDLGTTTQNWLGRSQWTTDAYLMGALDEFRIYNRALTAGEVRYLAGDR